MTAPAVGHPGAVPADVVLAHYGGAPEALTLGLPVVIFAGFLLLEKRARRREREREEQLQDPGPDLDGQRS